VLRDVAIDWPAGVEAWPKRIPDLYAGEPVVVAARLDRKVGTLKLHGVRAGAEWSQSITLDSGRADAGVGKLWARRKIDALMDAEREGASEAKAEIVQVALDHTLVSKYTSLVAVETTRARPANEPLDGAMLPVSLPEGMVHEAVFGELPQTATPAMLHLLIGLLALLGCACMWPLRTRVAA
jgi:Ca-activated chloride channel family protein